MPKDRGKDLRRETGAGRRLRGIQDQHLFHHSIEPGEAMTKKTNVLVVEDKQGTVTRWKNHFEYNLKEVSAKYAKSYDDVHRLVQEEKFVPDVAIIDHRLKHSDICPGASGLEVADFLQKSISQEVHMIAASAFVREYSNRGDSLHKAYKRFGVRIIPKGSDVVAVLEEYLRNRIKEVQNPSPLYEKIASLSKSMRSFLDKIRLYIDCEKPLLLQGGPGTGKRYIAETIHDLNHASGTKKAEFKEVNCSTCSPEKLETELLGDREGTVLMTEIDRLPVASLSRLSQILRNRKNQTGKKAGLRIIATSSAALANEADEATFKQSLDSSFRAFDVPVLKDRRADIIPLAEAHFAGKHEGYILDDESKRILRGAPWPNNIAGLFNSLDQAVIESEGIKLLTPDLFDDLVAVPELPSETAEETPPVSGKPRHTIRFCDAERLVQIDDRVPVYIKSPKQYSVLWAFIESNNPESKRDTTTHDIFELAQSKETEIWDEKIDKGSHFGEDDSNEINKYLRPIRNYIEKSKPRLDFLEQVLPESGDRKVTLSDYKIEANCSLSGGKRISGY
ncbi:sigma 54-interacting transcriptional regulator [Pontiellaceae bacterium B12227]|nr:sigma 54-interacting transcriptional regulator [Pontiellaceae bacterium B12227]